MPTALTLLLCAGLLASADEEVDCGAMKLKNLRLWLKARGLKCEGCAEKADYVALCEQNRDAPVQMTEPSGSEPAGGGAAGGGGKDQSIEDLLAGMKGMPGSYVIGQNFVK